eukprot:1179969-Prorocentrum_minimum.AAC.2
MRCDGYRGFHKGFWVQGLGFGASAVWGLGWGLLGSGVWGLGFQGFAYYEHIGYEVKACAKWDFIYLLRRGVTRTPSSMEQSCGIW